MYSFITLPLSKETLINPPNPLHLLALTPRLKKPAIIRPIDRKNFIFIPLSSPPSPIDPSSSPIPLQQPRNFRTRVHTGISQRYYTDFFAVRHGMYEEVWASELDEAADPFRGVSTRDEEVGGF